MGAGRFSEADVIERDCDNAFGCGGPPSQKKLTVV